MPTTLLRPELVLPCNCRRLGGAGCRQSLQISDGPDGLLHLVVQHSGGTGMGGIMLNPHQRVRLAGVLLDPKWASHLPIYGDGP